MLVFLTNASGWVGSALASSLIKKGHTVIALARSDSSAAKAKELGVSEVLRGSLEDLDALKAGAEKADATIHTAFHHDFTDYMIGVRKDTAAIEAIAQVLEGTNKVFITTSGTACAKPGVKAVETAGDQGRDPQNPRAASESLVQGLASKGIKSAVVRLAPTVHGGADDWAFIPALIQHARKNGKAFYVGDGANRWPAVHRFDAVELYTLALEKSIPGAMYHGVAEEEIPFRSIAEAIGAKLGVPAESTSTEHLQKDLGFIGLIASLDTPVSSSWTREKLGWQPREIGLLRDIAENY